MRPILWLSVTAILLLLVADSGQIVRGGRGWPSAGADADRLHRELDARQQGMLRRLSDKEAAVAALLRGELTLHGAAARFREADAGDAVALARLRARHAGASDEQMYCRQVIDFLRAHGRPAPAKVLAARLEAGLRGPLPAAPGGSGSADDGWRVLAKGRAGTGAVPAKKTGPKGSPARPPGK